MATASSLHQSHTTNIPSPGRGSHYVRANVGLSSAVTSNSASGDKEGGRDRNGVDRDKFYYMARFKNSILAVNRYTSLDEDVIISKIRHMENQGDKITTETLLEYTLSDIESDGNNLFSSSPKIGSNDNADNSNYPLGQNGLASSDPSKNISNVAKTTPNGSRASSVQQSSHSHTNISGQSGSGQAISQTSLSKSSALTPGTDIEADSEDVVDGLFSGDPYHLPQFDEDVVDNISASGHVNNFIGLPDPSHTGPSSGKSFGGPSSEVVSRIKESTRQPGDQNQSFKRLNDSHQSGQTGIPSGKTQPSSSEAAGAQQDLQPVSSFESSGPNNAEASRPVQTGEVKGEMGSENEDPRIHTFLKLVTNENELLEESRCCSVCAKNPRDITFLPCGHFTACRECAGPLYTCPICKKDIRATVDTYLS